MLIIPSYIKYNYKINENVKDTEIYNQFLEKEKELNIEINKLKNIISQYNNKNITNTFTLEENGEFRLRFTYTYQEKIWSAYYILNNNIFSNSGFIMDYNHSQIIFNNIYSLINEVKKEIDTVNLIKMSEEILKIINKLYNYKEESVEENLKIVKKEFKQSRKENIHLIIENIKKGNRSESIYELSFSVKNGKNELWIKKINHLIENIYFYEDKKIFKDRSYAGKNTDDITESDINDYIEKKLKDRKNIYINNLSEEELKVKYKIDSMYSIDINYLAQIIVTKNNIKNF